MSSPVSAQIKDETSSTCSDERMDSSKLRSIVDKPRKSIGSIRERLQSGRGKKRSRQMLKSESIIFSTHAKETFEKIQSVVTLTSASAISMVDMITSTNKVSVAKWSRKLYGSDKAVEDEQQRLQGAGRFVIHPFSNFRLTWDVLCTMFILADIVIIPMNIAFSLKHEDHNVLGFKMLSCVWFVLDIILNFRTGVQVQNWDKTSLQLNPREIRNWYLKGWFAIDLITTIPIDALVHFLAHETDSATRSFKGHAMKVVSLIRVARLPRLIRGINHFQEIINLQYDITLSFLRFAYIVFFVFMTVHFNGCLQYMIPKFYDFPDDTWVKMRNLHLPNVTWWEAYSWSLFKSTSQMLCIGYSQVIPVGMIDLWITMYSQLMGAFFFAIFVGNAITIMEESEAGTTAFVMKLSEIQQYLSFRRVPQNVKRIIIRHCQTRYRGKLFNEREILDELTQSLRREVVWHNTSYLIQSVPIFEDVSDDFIFELGNKLRYVIYMPRETIVKEGTQANHLFFLIKGDVEIRSKSYRGTLRDGDHFGEASLFSSEMRRSADVIALDTAHIYLLHRTEYRKLLQEFPEQKTKIESNIRKISFHSGRYEFVKIYNPDLDPGLHHDKNVSE